MQGEVLTKKENKAFQKSYMKVGVKKLRQMAGAAGKKSTTSPFLFMEAYRVVGQHWSPCVTPNPEWLPFWAPFFGRNGPLWEVRVIEISMQEPNFGPSTWFGPPIFGVQKS